MEKDFVVSELIGQGIAYTIMGMCVVFFILIIIMFVIKAMALFSGTEEKKVEEPLETVPAVQAETDDFELIAVITAAVAASLNTSTACVRVKSYKKIGAWSNAAKREVMENRF